MEYPLGPRRSMPTPAFAQGGHGSPVTLDSARAAQTDGSTQSPAETVTRNADLPPATMQAGQDQCGDTESRAASMGNPLPGAVEPGNRERITEASHSSNKY